jgi:membrane-associated phospholipid phosphatase
MLRAAAAGWLLLAPLPFVGAQPLPPATDPAHAPGAPGPAVRSRDAAALGGVLAVSLALMAADERIARWSQQPAVQRPAPIRHTAAVFRTLGDPGALTLGGLTYAVGLARRDRATAEVGLHTGGAVLVASAASVAVKAVVGRARPYVTGDTNAHSFALGRGLRGKRFQSFPSGHATAAFSFAAALGAEGRHRWPSANRYTEPLAYSMASLVALSRIYHDRHWASDVVMGAGVGIVAGRAVVRYQRARPRNALDGRLLPPRRSRHAEVPASFGWSVRF